MKKRVLYVVQEYPQLSETYIYNEIENVSHLYELEIFSMRQADLPYKNHRAYSIGGNDPKQALDSLVEQFDPQIYPTRTGGNPVPCRWSRRIPSTPGRRPGSHKQPKKFYAFES